MATLDDAENFLAAMENSLADLNAKYNDKQSDRILSSHVWMSDYIQNKIKSKVISLSDALSTIKDKHVGDFKSTTQFDAIIKYCHEINRLLDDLNMVYLARASIIDIKLKFSYNIPQILDKTKSIRNRFNIIRGQITRKKFEYEDKWF